MKRLVTGIAIGVVAGLLVGGGFVWATIPNSSTGVVTACYPTSGPSQGALRVIDAQSGQTCNADEQQIGLPSQQCNGYPLAGVDWHNCDLHKAYLNAQYLEGSNLSGANLSGANLTRSDLTRANLTGANLSGANLPAANLQGANVMGANFTNAKLSPYTLKSTTGVGGYTRLSGAAGFTSAMLRSVANASHQPPCFSQYPGITGPDLRWISFGSMNLTGFDFSGAMLNESRMPLAKLSTANFSDTDLTRLDLTAANLSGTNFTCAAVFQVKLNSANLTNANFTNARLGESVGMSTANLTGAIWNNTVCPDYTNSDANGGTCIGHL
ncbi:MAG: pentapeptide repeat-containing protein [Microthrixaceae bacterium]